jgi:hypothetical protein
MGQECPLPGTIMARKRRTVVTFLSGKETSDNSPAGSSCVSTYRKTVCFGCILNLIASAESIEIESGCCETQSSGATHKRR